LHDHDLFAGDDFPADAEGEFVHSRIERQRPAVEMADHELVVDRYLNVGAGLAVFGRDDGNDRRNVRFELLVAIQALLPDRRETRRLGARQEHVPRLTQLPGLFELSGFAVYGRAEPNTGIPLVSLRIGHAGS
jgi:hypothetical protein